MQTNIYDINDGDFANWLEAHSDCVKLKLCGKMIDSKHCKQLQEIEHTVSSRRIEEIDISDLDCQESHLTDIQNEDDYYDFDESYDADCSLNVLSHMFANKNYATDFVWCGDALLSSDLGTLVYYKPVKKIVIPSTVKIIGNRVFEGFEDLWKITLPEHIKVIGDYAFAHCNNLHTIVFPKTITYLGEGAFYECDLQDVDFPEGIDYVPECCFTGNFINKINLPSTVKKICSHSFSQCLWEMWLPDGIEVIDFCAFGGIRFIHISATVKTIDKEFFQDEDGWCNIPYVDVSPDNPYFFDKAGTLYKVGETLPYLGREFIPEQEESWLIPTSQFKYEREYTLEELKNIYYCVDPINKEQTMFCVWNGKESYYNIIDRFCNEYFKRKLVDSILFSFDNFILVNKTAVYSIDMKELLLYSAILEYDITSCDNEGRIYVMKGEPEDEFYKDIFPCHTLPLCWCIDVKGKPLLKNKYNGLKKFDANGYAPACMGKLWGMIDKDEDLVIPYAYKSIGYFDSKGMALVEKGNKKGYVNKSGSLVIPFYYNFFYKEFHDDDYAYAIIYKGDNAGEYFVDRNGKVLGKFHPRSEYDMIYEPGFHVFYYEGKYGYCKQFARDFSGCIYHDIKVIDEHHIEVSIDGVNYQKVQG